MSPFALILVCLCIIYCHAFVRSATTGLPKTTVPRFAKETPSESNVESTFVMIKPDAIQKRLVGEVISRFERKGLSLVAMRMLHPSITLLEKHYEEHKGRHYFEQMISKLSDGNVVAMVWSGPRAIAAARQLVGATDPVQAVPGSLRGDFGLQVDANVCHGSDSCSAAEREIALWFPELLSRDSP